MEYEDGMVFVSEDCSEKYIFVNDYRNPEAKRLIIAYELSFYFLYYEIDNQIFQHNKIINQPLDKDVLYMANQLITIKVL